jgi:hypothetical protein
MRRGGGATSFAGGMQAGIMENIIVVFYFIYQSTYSTSSSRLIFVADMTRFLASSSPLLQDTPDANHNDSRHCQHPPILLLILIVIANLPFAPLPPPPRSYKTPQMLPTMIQDIANIPLSSFSSSLLLPTSHLLQLMQALLCQHLICLLLSLVCCHLSICCR